MTALVVARTAYRDANGDLRVADPLLKESATDLDEHARPLEQIHGSGLHLWGVAEGLGVTATAAQAGVTVSPGIALDLTGRHVSLATGGRARWLNGHIDVLPPTPAGAGGAKVPTAQVTGTRFLTIAWSETRLATSYTLEHTPLFELLAPADLDAALRNSRVVLARMVLGAAGIVQSLDAGPPEDPGRRRRGTGLPVERIALRRPNASALAITDVPAGELRARQDGGLEIETAGALRITGDTAIGISTAPRTALHLPARGLQIGDSVTAADNVHIRSDTTGGPRALRIYSGDHGAGTPLITVLPDGSTGIGVTAPRAPLHVRDGGLQVGASSTAAGNFQLRVDAVNGPRALRVYNGDHGTPSPHLLTVLPSGNVGVRLEDPRYALTVGGDIATLGGMIQTGRWDWTSSASGDVVGAIGFVGPPVQHGQLSFRVGFGFELVDRSRDFPSLAYARGSYPYADLTVQDLEGRAARLGSGARISGVAIGGTGQEPGPQNTSYNYPYETVGTTQTTWNLRLQSANAIIFHSGGSTPPERMTLHGTGHLAVNETMGVGRSLSVGEDLTVGRRLSVAGNAAVTGGFTVGGDAAIAGLLTAQALRWTGDRSGQRYVRLGGMQICWGDGAFPGSGQVAHSFQESFAETPAITVTLSNTRTGRTVGAFGPTPNGFIALYNNHGDAGTVWYTWIAIGRI